VTSAVRALEAHQAEILEASGSGSLAVRTAFGVPGLPVSGARVPGGHASEAGYTLLTRTPVIVADLRNETRFRADPRLLENDHRSAIVVPIAAPNGFQGVLAVHAQEVREFSTDDVLFLEAIANILALHSARENQRRAISRLLAKALAARDDERRHLARELHDETGQSLTAMLLGLVTVEQSRTLEETRALAGRLRQITSRTIEDLGRIARGLYPSILHEFGLIEAVTRHVQDFETSCRCPVELEIRGFQKRLPSRAEVALYRVVQEALTNCARYAQASRVRVELSRSASEAMLTVQDNGVGFDVTHSVDPPANGLGLPGMRERVTRAGGTMVIDSAPGAGTTIIVRIPLPPPRRSPARRGE
jgi:signal transduction histidine kinase